MQSMVERIIETFHYQRIVQSLCAVGKKKT